MSQRHRVVIFGGGHVGTAMSLEMPRVPVVRRGADLECDVACICWPAQAVRDFAAECPLGARAHKVTFCNGAWSVEDGADSAGVCYVRAVNLGDRAVLGRKGWRVGRRDVATLLAAAGLGVTCSRTDHATHVWAKVLYLLPLALACADTGVPAREAAETEEYAGWYDVVRGAAASAIGEVTVAGQEPHVQFLVGRTPRRWLPSPSLEELAYFRERLGVQSC